MKSKYLKILILNLFLFLPYEKSFAQTDEKSWKTLEATQYSIQYPAAWSLDQNGQMNTSFILFSPLASPEDKFKENVNLLIQDLRGMQINLDKYVEISTGQIKTMMPNSSIIESKRIKNKTSEYHSIIYNGDNAQFHLTFIQYYFIYQEKAFVLTFTAEADKYQIYKAVGEGILKSFSLKR